MDRKKSKKKTQSPKEDEKVVMMACCHNGEDAGEIKEKVLLKIGEKLEGRSNVVMTRLNGEDLTQMDALIEVEVFKSRSEAAAFFIKEGINARKDLFDKVMPSVEKIRELKEQAKNQLSQDSMRA